MKKISNNTIKAIQKRIDNGENGFYIGAYYYSVDTCNAWVRRREQRPGYTPSSDWERVCDLSYDPDTCHYVCK